jgi:serine/threonine protein kinase/Flp pilus assembly protein TadD
LPPDIDEILERASELTPQARLAFLEEACAGDRALFEEARSLVDLLPESRGFLDLEPAAGPVRTIGKYVLGRILGTGGMGTVYLAERADGEFQRKVAIKIAHSGIQTPEVSQRFHSEKRILARLDHQGIARLLDGGTTADGRPYLIMEHVEGDPIDRYCDQNRLPVEARIELVRAVADAVQHAHDLQIVHRDLKPANVYIDRNGRPKLLDFGIAKVLSPTDRAEQTRTGFQRMTPRYASPEQILHREITPGSDVYSLAVLLFELLTGGFPYDIHVSPLELAEAIVREEPDRPSDVARRAGPGVLVARREANPASLAAKFRGNVDQILLRALSKDPAQRYSNALELSEDLGRHSTNRPVQARPISFAARARRLLARNPIALTLDARRQARAAEIQKEISNAMVAMLEDVLRAIDPRLAQGRDIALLRSLLDDTAKRVRRELGPGTPVAARLQTTIGDAYAGVGVYDIAELHLREALSARKAGNSTPAELAESYERLGSVLIDLNRHSEAESTLQDALSVARRVDPRNLGFEASIHRNLGKIYDYLGDDARARENLTAAVEIGTRASGRESLQVIESISSLAYFLVTRDHVAEAEALSNEALALARRSGDAPILADALRVHGFLLRWTRRNSEAEGVFRETLGIQERTYGAGHPRLAVTQIDLASVLEFQGRCDEAYGLYQEAIQIQRHASGARSMAVGTTLNNLGGLLRKTGRLAEAQEALEEAISIYREELGESHTWIIVARSNHVMLLIARGDYAAAETEIVELMDVSRARWGEDDWHVAIQRSVYGTVLTGLGRNEEAEKMLRSSLQRLEEALGSSDARTNEARDRLDTFLRSTPPPTL